MSPRKKPTLPPWMYIAVCRGEVEVRVSETDEDLGFKAPQQAVSAHEAQLSSFSQKVQIYIFILHKIYVFTVQRFLSKLKLVISVYRGH